MTEHTGTDLVSSMLACLLVVESRRWRRDCVIYLSSTESINFSGSSQNWRFASSQAENLRKSKPWKNNPSDNSGRDSVTESQLSCLSKRQMENIRLCHFPWHRKAGEDNAVHRCVVTLPRWGSEKVSHSLANNTLHAGLCLLAELVAFWSGSNERKCKWRTIIQVNIIQVKAAAL